MNKQQLSESLTSGFKPHVMKLRHAYAGLSDREKNSVAALTVFLLIGLAYFALWSPSSSYLENARESWTRQNELLQWMRSTEGEARNASRENPSRQSGQPLLSEVSSSAARFKITPTRMQPEGEERVSVWFEDVVFNDLIKWLQMLEQQGMINVRQISIDARAEPGKVSARMVLGF